MYVRVRALQQLEAVGMADEVLHELSVPQSHGSLRREVAHEVAVPP